LRALARFAALAPQLHVGALAGIATAAVRDAEDGAAFCVEVERRTGIRLRVATGAEEAALAGKGVLFGNPGARGVAVDLGGGSMEFCRIGDGRTETGLTTPLGPLRLRARARRTADLDREIRRYLDTLADSYRLDGGCLYLVGGAFRALARAQMSRTGYPLEVLHEYRMDAAAALDLAEWAAATKPEKLAELQGVSPGRAPDMPLSARLLGHLVRTLGPGAVQVSAFGLREGVCLDNLSQALRREDALLAGAREQERRRARAPGFGEELGAWVVRLLIPDDPAEERLMRAAAILSDVNWRTHPDYRAQNCWETVTRVNLTDLGHEGRVFIGMALVARYDKRARKWMGETGALALLPERRQAAAMRLGLAMRLGSVLSGSAPGVLDWCEAERIDGRLVLTLRGPAEPFAGEEVEKRLSAFARSLDLGWRLRTGSGAETEG
jgi:exopolyphosphatase/guanosine-5'-triphosphate,3'-diphosphate pyrophosphatase